MKPLMDTTAMNANDRQTDFVEDSNRLQVALGVLGFKPETPKHQRHILVRNIESYASFIGDESLELQCNELMSIIENE